MHYNTYPVLNKYKKVIPIMFVISIVNSTGVVVVLVPEILLKYVSVFIEMSATCVSQLLVISQFKCMLLCVTKIVWVQKHKPMHVWIE